MLLLKVGLDEVEVVRGRRVSLEGVGEDSTLSHPSVLPANCSKGVSLC
jgi:hypothetical protein